jgi:hypothetical protein
MIDGSVPVQAEIGEGASSDEGNDDQSYAFVPSDNGNDLQQQ